MLNKEEAENIREVLTSYEAYPQQETAKVLALALRALYNEVVRLRPELAEPPRDTDAAIEMLQSALINCRNVIAMRDLVLLPIVERQLKNGLDLLGEDID